MSLINAALPAYEECKIHEFIMAAENVAPQNRVSSRCLVGKPMEKRPLARPRRWDSIRSGLLACALDFLFSDRDQ
jgi:hypothetical protein